MSCVMARFPPTGYTPTARVCPCLSNLRWTLRYWWMSKGVCVLVCVCVCVCVTCARAADWVRARAACGDVLMTSQWQPDRQTVPTAQQRQCRILPPPLLSLSFWHPWSQFFFFFFVCVCVYTRPCDANARSSGAEAGDRRGKKRGKMDAKPGVTDVWEEVPRVISARFSHRDRFLNKSSPTPAGHLSPSKQTVQRCNKSWHTFAADVCASEHNAEPESPQEISIIHPYYCSL